MPWYYAEGSNRNGPIDEDAFGELVRAEVIRDSTLVWREGMQNWEPFANLRAQARVAPAAPPHPPPPVSAGENNSPAAAAVYCSQCGRASAPYELVAVGGRLVCANCKPILLQQIREGSAATAAHVYAGFWVRVAALLVDTVVLSAVNWVLSLAMLGSLLTTASNPDRIGAALAGAALFYMVAMAIALGYEIWFTVRYNATPGKMALGLKIIRAQGGPISYGLATGRYFAKILDGMTLGIGYMMAGWDSEKRALHDRICDTRVVRAR